MALETRGVHSFAIEGHVQKTTECIFAYKTQLSNIVKTPCITNLVLNSFFEPLQKQYGKDLNTIKLQPSLEIQATFLVSCLRCDFHLEFCFDASSRSLASPKNNLITRVFKSASLMLIHNGKRH